MRMRNSAAIICRQSVNSVVIYLVMRMLFLVCVPQSIGFLDERLLLAVAQDPATKYNSQSPVLLLNARNMYLLKIHIELYAWKR